MTNRPFADWLQERLGERNLSGRTFARRLGLSTMTVYNWLRGESTPHSVNHAALAEALGITIDELRRAIGETPAPGAH